MNVRRVRATMLTLACVGAVAALAVPANAAVRPAVADVATSSTAALSITEAWAHTINGGAIQGGSAGVADLDGSGPSVIVGTTSGVIDAFHAGTGTAVAGWPRTSSVEIMSTPSTLGSGPTAKVFFGLGAAPAPTKGGYLALGNTSKTLWYRGVHLLPNNAGELRGVMSSLAIGNLQTGADVVGGAMGQMQLAIAAKTGKTLNGFPWLMADTNFSTPAVARLFSTHTRDYIVEGGDSTAGRAYYQTYTNGGHIRVLSPLGFSGKKSPNDGLVCQVNTTQVVQSSPAVGNFLGGEALGIVVGTGTFYKGASDTNKIIAITPRCARGWSVKLDGSSAGSPALADVLMTGKLDVVTVSGAGTVYALDGATGHLIWKTALHVTAASSVTTFEYQGRQIVIAPTNNGLYLLDGATGAVLNNLAPGMHLQNSATVTRDPNGQIGITVGGGGRNSAGAIAALVRHFTIDGSNVTTVQTPGAWPMFHHDPQLTGFSVLG